MTNPYCLLNKRFHPTRSKCYVEYVPSVNDVTMKDDPLLDYIFGVNPVTGLPEGDIAMFLSDKTNPEIKNFISQQLLIENGSSDEGLSLPDSVTNRFREVISDDDIASFSRNHGETTQEYASRLRNWFAEEKQRNAEKRDLQKFRSLLHDKKA